MGNLSVAAKRFLGNKNTVTIIGVLAGIAVLYFGYNWRVQQAIEPQAVPFAKQAIPGNTLITTEMLGTVKVSKNMVDTTPDLVTSSGQVIGKYVRYDTVIPQGSLFYRPQLMVEEELPNAMIKDIPDGYTVYSLGVTMKSTYANSIMPGDVIDLYFKFQSDENLIVFGKFIDSIPVLAVKDSQGQHVFSSISSGIPAELIFAVPDYYFDLLRRSDYITTNAIVITPVPRNKDYTDNAGDTMITSEEIVAFIDAKSQTATQNAADPNKPDPNKPDPNKPTQ